MTVSSLDLSSTRMISSTQSAGITETVRSSVRAAFQAGITTITLPSGRSGTAGIHVDAAAAAGHALGGDAGEAERHQRGGGGDRVRPLVRLERPAARGRAPH